MKVKFLSLLLVVSLLIGIMPQNTISAATKTYKVMYYNTAIKFDNSQDLLSAMAEGEWWSNTVNDCKYVRTFFYYYYSKYYKKSVFKTFMDVEGLAATLKNFNVKIDKKAKKILVAKGKYKGKELPITKQLMPRPTSNEYFKDSAEKTGYTLYINGKKTNLSVFSAKDSYFVDADAFLKALNINFCMAPKRYASEAGVNLLLVNLNTKYKKYVLSEKYLKIIPFEERGVEGITNLGGGKKLDEIYNWKDLKTVFNYMYMTGTEHMTVEAPKATSSKEVYNWYYKDMKGTSKSDVEYVIGNFYHSCVENSNHDYAYILKPLKIYPSVKTEKGYTVEITMPFTEYAGFFMTSESELATRLALKMTMNGYYGMAKDVIRYKKDIDTLSFDTDIDKIDTIMSWINDWEYGPRIYVESNPFSLYYEETGDALCEVDFGNSRSPLHYIFSGDGLCLSCTKFGGHFLSCFGVDRVAGFRVPQHYCNLYVSKDNKVYSFDAQTGSYCQLVTPDNLFIYNGLIPCFKKLVDAYSK